MLSCAIFATVAPLILSATPIYFTPGTVDFNGSSPGTLTLGSDNCTPTPGTCTLTVAEGGTLVGTVTLSFTMPNLTTSPFSYSDEPSLITTSGSPTLFASLSDTYGDSATGTFALTNLLSDGVTGTGGFTGVDIDGSITINSIIAGTDIASFESLFGLPSSTALAFTLDVGNCKTGSQATPCITAADPTAQLISLNLTPGTQDATPEPGTFGLFGCGMGVIFAALRRRQSRRWLGLQSRPSFNRTLNQIIAADKRR